MIYVPTNARVQAGGFGFQNLQAGPKAASSQAQGLAWPGFFWPGLAWLLALGRSRHITSHYDITSVAPKGLETCLESMIPIHMLPHN